jgi:hypothetical protein
MAYSRRDDWVKSPLGLALAGAELYVCTQPATDDVIPPSPLATIYGSTTGGTPLSQPLSADGFGHTFFYADATVLYTLVWVYSGVIAQVLPDQALASVPASSTPAPPFVAPVYHSVKPIPSGYNNSVYVQGITNWLNYSQGDDSDSAQVIPAENGDGYGLWSEQNNNAAAFGTSYYDAIGNPPGNSCAGSFNAFAVLGTRLVMNPNGVTHDGTLLFTGIYVFGALGTISWAEYIQSTYATPVGTILGTTESPVDFVGFRSSGGSTWHAYVGNTSAFTEVNTNIALDTSSGVSHAFAVTCTGTSVYTFYIDNVQVAQISTTVPPVADLFNIGVAFNAIDNGNVGCTGIGFTYLVWGPRI